ncbi:hypothetical protein [Micromonospora sp. NPDC049662]|uniref:hypothetical protein n=1 Tax=Micromonospora sp. NPDC049662 TaxID=3155397 RepID=UPI0034168E2D
MQGTATMTVSRRPADPRWSDLGSTDQPGDDFHLLVDDAVVGGTYWCGAGDIPDGQRWASWGPAGLSMRHRTRADAEQVQVRAYAVNPDVVDRQIAERRREAAAEATLRDAGKAARAQARRAVRLGADEPGPTVWALPSYHFLFGAHDEVATVAGWLGAHQLHRVSGRHEIRIEQRAARRVVVVEELVGWSSSATQTRVVTCTIDPPPVDTTPRPDLVDLLVQHYPTTFPLIDFGQQLACAACTKHTSPRAVTPWPCSPFVTARDAPQPGGAGRPCRAVLMDHPSHDRPARPSGTRHREQGVTQ